MKSVVIVALLFTVYVTSAAAAVCKHSPLVTQFGHFVVCASSVLGSQSGNTYGPLNVIDGNVATAWVEGVPGYGEGESIQIDFDGEMAFQSLFITNGYNKSLPAFYNNARVREVRIETADRYESVHKLSDRMGSQEIRLPRIVRTSWIKLTLLSVYPGTKWDDTAISEILIDLEEHNYDFSVQSDERSSRENPGDYLTEERALYWIMETREVDEWAGLVRENGNKVIWEKEQDAPDECPALDCLWCFRLMEDLPTHVSTFGSYCINAHTHDVLAIDPVTEQPRFVN